MKGSGGYQGIFFLFAGHNWIPKIERNRQCDAENVSRLRESGRDVFVIWECEITEQGLLSGKLTEFITKKMPDKALNPDCANSCATG